MFSNGVVGLRVMNYGKHFTSNEQLTKGTAKWKKAAGKCSVSPATSAALGGKDVGPCFTSHILAY